MTTDITIYQGDGTQSLEPSTPPAHYVLSLDACIAAWVNVNFGIP